MLDFIRNRLGITLREFQKDSLRSAVAQACEHFAHATPADLLNALRSGARNELEYLTLQITVGESYFFRDSRQIAYLRDHWLPALIARKRQAGSRSIRILSAGCAGGQEIYTLAILLNQALPDIDAWNLHLLGSDINTASLAQALQGSYNPWSLRATPPALRQQFFTEENGEYLIHKHLRNQARFFYLNLVADHYPTVATGTNALDLILCRNVFIYFDPPSITTVLRKFSACLESQGVLMLGASDIVDCRDTGLRLVQQEDLFWYERDHEWALTSAGCPATAVGKPALATVSVATAPPAVVQAEVDEVLQYVQTALREGRGQDAMAWLERHMPQFGDHARMWYFKARLLADQGDLTLAEEACLRSLALDSTDKHSHLLHAIILSEQNRPAEAEKAFRKSIFIDNNFIEAHFQLGMLLLRGDKRKQGLKSLHNALRICEQSPAGQVLTDDPELTLGRLAEILRKELSIYE